MYITKKALAVIGVLIVGVLFVGVVYAQSDNEIQACVKNNGGIRIVESPSDCKNNETSLTWNIQGPLGPQGDMGPQGPPGEQGPPGKDADETAIYVAIDAERSAREGADEDLGEKLNESITETTQKLNELSQSLADAIREGIETAKTEVLEVIDLERAEREAADGELEAKIEESINQAAEKIQEVSQSMSDKVKDAIETAKAAIYASIGELENALNNEITSRIARDTELQAQIDSIELLPGPPGTDGADGAPGIVPDQMCPSGQMVVGVANGMLVCSSQTSMPSWYADTDGDGFGDPSSMVLSETQPFGYVADSTDCDDSDPSINPDAAEINGDGIDQDCDGLDPTDPTQGPGNCLTSEEATLVDLINDYRAVNGLTAIPISKSLVTVGQWHVLDLDLNNPQSGQDCNLHSWSDWQPSLWSSVCYTHDHQNAAGMWDKPREITGDVYYDNGYELASGGAGQITAAQAFSAWQGSAGHNNVLLNQDIWSSHTWSAMGVGIYEGFAVVWFGETVDPQGSVGVCVP